MKQYPKFQRKNLLTGEIIHELYSINLVLMEDIYVYTLKFEVVWWKVVYEYFGRVFFR